MLMHQHAYEEDDQISESENGHLAVKPDAREEQYDVADEQAVKAEQVAQVEEGYPPHRGAAERKEERKEREERIRGREK